MPEAVRSELLPQQKAISSATEAAAQRQRRAAEYIEAHCLPSGAVLVSRMWRRPGQLPVLLVYQWPGALMVKDPNTGRVLRYARASYMHKAMPEATVYLQGLPKARELLCATLPNPQGVPSRLVFDAWGVLTVRSAKTGEVLAKSKPGKPAELQPGFCPLSLRDLAPRLT